MTINYDSLNQVLNDLEKYDLTQLLIVTKNQTIQDINELISKGFDTFGENKVQEAKEKWTNIKKETPTLNLHFVGKLQTNKAKDVIKLFDYVHSLENIKQAEVLSRHEKNLNKKLKYFIQVNIGNEIQKSGIPVNELDAFYNYCINEIKLEIIGLMVIPPNDNKPEKYFKSLNELNKSLELKNLSMGMSADYIEAIKYGSNYVRIGSSIFGDRS